MADSVAQSVKSLKKNLEELDTQLLKEQNAAKKLGEVLQTAMKDAGVSVDDFVKAVRNKMNSATKANKISLVLELTDAKGRPLTAASIQNEISALTSSGNNPIRLNELKELQKIMGDPTKFYDELMGIVNKMGGSKKSNASSEWREMTRLNNQLKKSILDTRNAIDQQTESIRRQKSELSRLQSLLQRQKNGIVGIDYKSEESKTRAIAKTNAQIKKTEENIRAAEQEVDRLNKKLGQTESQTQKVEQNTKRTKKSLSDMLPTLRRLASAFGVAFSVQGLVQFGKKLVETRGEFELQQVALRSILQNKQVADEIWNKTMQQALQSPFRAMQLTKYTKQLAAYRIETEKLFDTTKMLADVSAGLGVDMQRLILAYGQVKAANYLRASEIRQFTEAGVNVLGELSTYFSKTRGEMVSTAQVMDMVQKRMVTFQDVEAIFKRMTDEGGVFYNMQYIQSQTVKGQINKLHDAYDQMLNSIGKGNQGAIRDLVAAANSIVQNWRYWAAAIKSIAFGALIASISKLAVMMSGVSVAGMAAGKGMTKFAGGVKALGVALKGNWLTLAIGAVVALGAELYNLNKRMKDINAEIDEQNLGLYETKERLEGYRDTIERNNKALAKSTGQEASLKKRREENAEILAKIKNDYPQLAEGMEIQKNGVIDLTDALRKENDELERQITLNTLMKQSSIFDKGFAEDAANLSKEYINQQQQIVAARAQARSLMVQFEQMGRKGDEEYNILSQIANINPENIQEATKSLLYLRNELYNIVKVSASGDIGLEYYRKYLRDFTGVSGSEKKLSDEFNKLGEYVGYELEKGLEEAYKEEIEKSGLSTLQWYALNVNKVQKDINDGVVDVYRFLREALEKNGQAQGPGMQAFWNNIVKTNYIDPYFKAWKLGMEEAEAGGWRFPMALPAEGGMPNIFATPKKGGGTSGNIITDDDGSKAKENASRLISLIREMRAEYDKLSKSAYGYAKSEDAVRKAYDKAMDEILVKAGVDKKYDFTTNEGMIAALEKVKAYALTNLGKEAAAEVEKYIGQLKTETTLNVQVRIREDFMREIEKMFSDYELTLDLQKINLPSDAAKDILGFDYTSLNSVLERVRKFRNDLENVVVGKDENGNDIIENHFDKDDQQAYANWMKKIEDQLFNIRKERAKQYTKYLEQELSERAKLEMQYVKDVAFVEANFKGEQKDAIKQNLQTNYEQALKEFEWKSFKESDFYVEMMQDLTSMPSEYLDLMMQKLNEWATKADILSPRALKEVLKAREKVMATQVALSPISALGQSLGVIRDFQGSGRTDAEGNAISKNIKESREQMQGIIVAREQEILKIKEKLALEEQLAGKIKAQEELQEILNQLTNKGVEGLQMTADAAQDLANIERASSNYGVRLSGLLAGGGVEQAEGETDADFQTRKRQYEDEVRELRAIIDLLNQLRERRVAASTAGVDPTKDYSAAKMASIKRITDLREQLTKAERKQAKDQGIMNTGYKAYNEAVHGLAKNIKDVTVKAKEMGNQLYETLEVLGVETDEVSNAWKEFGNSMSDVITSAIEMIPSLVTGFTSAGVAINTAMGVIGLIALAIQAVLSLLSGLSKIHDARLTREIRKQQEYIEDLRDAYERLEKQIEKTWSSTEYMHTYELQVRNIREQIDAMNSQMAAERSKKNSDESAILQYQRDIQNAYDQLEELEQKSIEFFGGIGEEGYRSAAEGFVDAWKSAFLETGDGLQGLEDHFDEFMQDWFTKQATMRVAGNMLEPLFRQIDAAVDRYGTGGTDAMLSEIARVREMAAAIFPDLSLALEDLAGMFGVGGEGSLSGLAAGIQGMTEEQANILEAYWNSVRMYTASIDMNVSRIAEMLGVGGPNSNPMLAQLQTIAENTGYIKDIYTMLNGTRRNLGNGQGFITYNQ